jgi:hypothetical protein
MAGKAKGLRVKYCENVAIYEQGRKCKAKYSTAKLFIPDGWFIQVWFSRQWKTLMDLRFVRERDAVMAAVALTRAGLNTYEKMRSADPMTVKQVACEALQW